MWIWMILILLALMIAAIAAQPSQFNVSRSLLIAAPREVLFSCVNNLQKWQSWSPWAQLDPNAKTVFEGPEEGLGAVMRWDGNKQVGTGSLEIVEIIPVEFVKYALIFVKPMPGTCHATFRFDEEGGMTRVTWSMTGHNNFVAKATSLVMNCDKMVGGYFEKGLQNLKELAERTAVPAA